MSGSSGESADHKATETTDSNKHADELPGDSGDKNNAASPEREGKPRHNLQRPKELWERQVARRFRALVTWLDKYNGAVTGIATVFIATFTIVLAVYAGDQKDVHKQQIKDSEATNRAFVFIDLFETDHVGPTLYVQPRWKNSGITPTRTMTMWTNWKWFPGKLPANFTFPDLDASGQPANVAKGSIEQFLGPGGNTYGSRLAIPYSLIPLVTKNKVTVLIYGWARYTDVFGHAHITRYANKIRAYLHPQPNGKKPTYDISFNEFPSHNCTDEECRRQGIP